VLEKRRFKSLQECERDLWLYNPKGWIVGNKTKPQAPRTLGCAMLGVCGFAEIASSAFVDLAKHLITGVL